MSSKQIVLTIVAVVYAAFCIWLGIYGKKRAERGGKFFFASSGLFGALLVGLAAAAAGMSGFGYVGGPGLAYKFGAAVWYLPTFFILSYGVMSWLNGKPMRMMQEITRIETFADLGVERYKNKAVGFFIALNLIFCIFAYLGTQVLAGGYVINALTGMNVKVAGLLLLVIVAIYTYYGGMVGSIMVDGLQGFLMVISIIGAFIGFFMITGGAAHWTQVVGSSPMFGPLFVDPVGKPTNLLLPLIFGWVFVLSLGVSGQPHVNTKYYALKSYKDLRWKGFIGGVGYGIAGFMYLLPAAAVEYLVATGKMAPLKVADTTVFAFANHLPFWVAAIIYMGLLAAIMSTSSSFLVIGSAVFTHDFPRAFSKVLSEKSEVQVGRIALLILSIGAAIFGLYGGYMVALLGVLGLGAFVSTSIPVVIGYVWKKATKEAALISEITVFILSIGISVIYEKLLGKKLPGGISGYVFYIIVTILIMVFVSFVTKGAAEEKLPAKLKTYFRYLG